MTTTDTEVQQLIINILTEEQYADINPSASELYMTPDDVYENKADIDLGNLSTTGQAIIDNKANKDLSNVTQTGKDNIMAWGMPDYTNITSTGNRTFNTLYNEGQAGIVFFTIAWDSNSGSSLSTIEINGVTVLSPINATYYAKMPTTFFVGAGDTYKVTINQSSYSQLWFIPLKGAN